MGRATSKGIEAKSKMKYPSDMSMPEIQTCGPMRYQLDHGGAHRNTNEGVHNIYIVILAIVT